jgi:hypothetical protein
MYKNFSNCPHCLAKGQHRVIRPATPHRTPLITRSDGTSFHLFVEESYIRRASSKLEGVALFRYDLDPAGAKAESVLAQLLVSGDDTTEALEELSACFAGNAPPSGVNCNVFVGRTLGASMRGAERIYRWNRSKRLLDYPVNIPLAI